MITPANTNHKASSCWLCRCLAEGWMKKDPKTGKRPKWDALLQSFRDMTARIRAREQSK